MLSERPRSPWMQYVKTVRARRYFALEGNFNVVSSHLLLHSVYCIRPQTSWKTCRPNLTSVGRYRPQLWLDNEVLLSKSRAEETLGHWWIKGRFFNRNLSLYSNVILLRLRLHGAETHFSSFPTRRTWFAFHDISWACSCLELNIEEDSQLCKLIEWGGWIFTSSNNFSPLF